MNKEDKIYVAGHTGLVGSALIRKLAEHGYNNLITCKREDLDLLDQQKVAVFFEDYKPHHVFFAAGKTGGIYANNAYRADFIYENIVMQSNVINQSFLHEVHKLMFYACSSIYPKICPQPMKEEYILTAPMELTNEPFAIAKIAGLKMCESFNRQYGTDFLTVIPTNLYGPNQKYDRLNALVVPSLIQKFHKAKEEGDESVDIWGSGHPIRDFLYVDDLAEASIFLMENFEGNLLLNVGTGKGHSIANLGEIIKKEVGYKGNIIYNASLPDGVSQKRQDVSKINKLGWKYSVGIEEGIHFTYQDYLKRVSSKEIMMN